MRCWLARADRVAWFTAALALIGCSAEPQYISIESADARFVTGGASVRVTQTVNLSASAREALRNGVPITLRIDVALHRGNDSAAAVRDAHRYEIRYLPLSEHYQLAGPGERILGTYPRLRHALAELQRVEVPLATDIAPSTIASVRVRTRLDPHRLPAPMRLPALVNPDWRVDSGWRQWPLESAG